MVTVLLGEVLQEDWGHCFMFDNIITKNDVPECMNAMNRDENGRKRSEEASIVFSFTFFLGNDIDNSIDGNEYGADNTGTSETKLSDRE